MMRSAAEGGRIAVYHACWGFLDFVSVPRYGRIVGSSIVLKDLDTRHTEVIVEALQCHGCDSLHVVDNLTNLDQCNVHTYMLDLYIRHLYHCQIAGISLSSNITQDLLSILFQIRIRNHQK